MPKLNNDAVDLEGTVRIAGQSAAETSRPKKDAWAVCLRMVRDCYDPAIVNEEQLHAVFESEYQKKLQEVREGKVVRLNTTNTTKHDKHDTGDTPRQKHDTYTTSTRHLHDKTRHERPRFQGNITAEVLKLIELYQGVFTNDQVCKDLGIEHRLDRQQVSRVLREEEYKKNIKKDGSRNGVWRKVETDLQEVNLFDELPTYLDIALPLYLDQMLKFTQKSLAVIAGSPNAGKSSFLIETLRLNLHGDMPILFLTCEAPSELVLRLRNNFTPEELELCKSKLKMYEIRSGQYADQIERLNPDGLTIVDYVEEPDGEPYKLARQFRDINEALNKGFAFCSLQKDPFKETGKGGIGTEEAARLYITMDNLLELDRRGSHVSELRIKKSKLPSDGMNHTGKVMHVEINNGFELNPLMPWCRHEGKPQKFREAKIAQYLDNAKQGRSLTDEPPKYGERIVCRVNTKDGGTEFLRQKTVEGWKKSFPNLSIEKELDDWLMNWITSKDGWNPKGQWVHQIRGMLKRKNDKGQPSQEPSDLPWE